MVLSGQKRSKVAPRRHVSSIPGLLHHSRRLHQALSALDREENRAQRRLSLTRVATLPQRCSTSHTSESTRPTVAVAAASKPLVFRKTKREIERERERALQEQMRMQQQQQLEDVTSSIIASCIRSTASKLQPSCRAEYLRSARQLRIGERGRSRRRLLF